jgi:hypothetical protein
VQSSHFLLSAEKAALNKKYETSETLYKEAIVLAGRTGHLHDAALANERDEDFFLWLNCPIRKRLDFE